MVLVADDYSKITDEVMILGLNAILKMNVSLKNNINDTLQSFHKEFSYYNSDGVLTASIRRSFDYYLSIENFKAVNGRDKEFIRIGLSELYRLREVIPYVIQWFNSEEFVGLFAYDKNNELCLDKQVDTIMVDKLAMGKFISFEPVVIQFPSGFVEGVRMYLNSNDNYIDMPYETRFIGFADLILHFDLYLAAQNLLNYFGRPDFGTNLTQIGSKFK